MTNQIHLNWLEILQIWIRMINFRFIFICVAMGLQSIILKLFRFFYCTFSLTEKNICMVTTTPLIIWIITGFLNIILSFLLNYEHNPNIFFIRGTSTSYIDSLGAIKTRNSLSPCECENHNLGPPSWSLMLIYDLKHECK